MEQCLAVGLGEITAPRQVSKTQVQGLLESSWSHKLLLWTPAREKAVWSTQQRCCWGWWDCTSLSYRFEIQLELQDMLKGAEKQKAEAQAGERKDFTSRRAGGPSGHCTYPTLTR